MGWKKGRGKDQFLFLSVVACFFPHENESLVESEFDRYSAEDRGIESIKNMAATLPVLCRGRDYGR